MQFKLASPSYSLAPWVKQYWAIDSVLPSGTIHQQRIVPTGLTELNFYLQDLPKASDPSKGIHQNSMIAGQLKNYYDLEIKGKISLFSILFQPYGLSLLCSIPASELYNQNIALRDLLKDEVSEIEDALYQASDFQDKVVRVESILLKFIRKKDQHEHFPRIFDSIRRINAQKGIVHIDQLAADACFSRKQYERVFADLVGSTPKQFLKTIRFQNALYQKSLDPDLSLTALSYAAGYYDQSHMTHDFLKLSGMTPKQYFKDCLPVSDYFDQGA